MVYRYACHGWDIRRGEMKREDDGPWVSYGDYEAIRSELEAVKREAVGVLKPLSDEFSRLQHNFEGFEKLFTDEVAYVGGRVNIGHLRAARAFVEKHGRDG